MDLIINGKIIDSPIMTILSDLRRECDNRYLSTIAEKGDNVSVTCPYHADGQEKHPSAYVYCSEDDPKIVYGTFKCFACQKAVQLYSLVGFCLGGDDKLGKKWLLDNYCNTIIAKKYNLPLLKIEAKKEKKKKYLDEKILDDLDFYHPYLEKRKINKSTAKRFRVGFDELQNTITFPVWDEYNRLVMITRRAVNTKRFFIPYGVEKPVYLLNFVNKYKISRVYVCESQINALTLWSWGYPAIALFGTGSSKQYEILKRSGIKNFVLCFDGDEAGKSGARKFIDNLCNYASISVKAIPQGKDVNDLEKEEFESLSIITNKINIK